VVVAPSPRAASTATCHLPDTDRAIPKTAPAGVTWELFDTVALPYSKTAGSEYVHGDIARCFARTPTGALIADLQISTRDFISADWRTVVAHQVVPGPGRTAYTKVRATASATNEPGDYCQTAGFAFLSWTPARSQIEVVGRCGSNLQAETTTVEWSGTDWRLVLQPNGSEASSVSRIASLVGFIQFGGV